MPGQQAAPATASPDRESSNSNRGTRQAGAAARVTAQCLRYPTECIGCSQALTEFYLAFDAKDTLRLSVVPGGKYCCPSSTDVLSV